MAATASTPLRSPTVAAHAVAMLRRLRAWLQPPRELKSTTMGKIVIALAILIGVAATNTGNNMLYLVLGGLFGIIASSGVLSERVLKGLEPTLEPPDYAVAGRQAVVGVLVTAHPRIDSHLVWVEVLDSAGQVLGRTLLRELAAATRRRVYVRLTPAARGLLAVAEVRFATRYPFQMYEKRRRVAQPAAVWVAPAPLPAPLPPRRAADWSGAAEPRRGRGDNGDFQGLRERIDSDAPSRIHWRRSAAAGAPLTKTFAALAEPTLHVTVRAGATDAEFETALATAAGWLSAARLAGVPVVLTLGAVRVAGGAGGTQTQAMVALARAQRGLVPVGAPAVDAAYGV